MRRPVAPLQGPMGLTPMTTTSSLVRTHFCSSYAQLGVKTQHKCYMRDLGEVLDGETRDSV